MSRKINIKHYLTPYVFYHNDMDGKSAAWILHDWFAENNVGDDPTDYQKFSYDGEMKLGSVTKEKVVFIVDLCFTTKTYETLLKICEKANCVVWIDHHDQSVELLKEHPELREIHNLFVFVTTTGSGSLLTNTFVKCIINYFYNPFEVSYKGAVIESNDILKNATVAIEYDKNEANLSTVFLVVNNVRYVITTDYWLLLVDDHDRYVNKLADQIDFTAGISMENTAISIKMTDEKGKQCICFNSDFWNFIDYGLERYIEAGNVINRYNTLRYSNDMKFAFEGKLPGTDVICLFQNARGNSYVFGSRFNMFDVVCLFHYNGDSKLWKYSLFSNPNSTFNCGEYCTAHGGGGHFHAAGFMSKELILDI